MITKTRLPKSIVDRIEAKERLLAEEGLELLSLQDPDAIAEVGALADRCRQEIVGEKVTFASTLMLYPTNLCELNCQFCSFYAKPGWDKAWFNTPSQIEERIRPYVGQLTEVHIVGGLWRDCNLDYYEELFSKIKALDPSIHIKALTPVEYDFLAKLHDLSIEDVLQKMVRWGLDSIPGGGAEILVEDVRKKIAYGKISTDEFLAVHDTAHRIGLKTNITMLFNHIETNEHIVEHLIRVREQQDKSGGFKTFVPLKFGTEDNALGKRKKQLKEKPIPLLYAVSRLMLDNIHSIKALWTYLGVDQALEMLNWGANDLSSTNVEEKVIQMAGGVQVKMNVATMERLIQEQGRIPQLTNSTHV